MERQLKQQIKKSDNEVKKIKKDYKKSLMNVLTNMYMQGYIYNVYPSMARSATCEDLLQMIKSAKRKIRLLRSVLKFLKKNQKENLELVLN